MILEVASERENAWSSSSDKLMALVMFGIQAPKPAPDEDIWPILIAQGRYATSENRQG